MSTESAARLKGWQPNINLMGMRRVAYLISGLLIVISIAAIAIRGFNFGVDFTGGTLVEVSYPQPIDLAGVRSALQDAGYPGAMAQYFGTPRDVLIRLAASGEADASGIADRVLASLRAAPEGASIELRRVEFVGPQVGKELAEYGSLAVLVSIIGILLYVGLRFEKRLAAGAVLGLVHDVIILLGVWAVFQLDFDLTVLAGLLATIGYSLNDTIVIYDRVRENFRKLRKGEVVEIVNVSINQTLTRTVITSGTTLLALIALYVFGGEILRNFSLVLILGIIVGTYSSVFVCSALALLLGVSKKDLMPVAKDQSASGAQL
ncbi:MAG: protein translocase subunit SecF [Gammaproteobacteria bacterium]|jgi:preprotein translocase subunit SecF|nr:protein translocase subunit SecF [Gammaproteobacteria bacterium]